VDVTATLDAPCSAEALFPWVADLGCYPRWLEIVPRAVAEDGDTDAWTVDLRGRLGPFARSKRLHMVRTVLDEPKRVRFERQERDGKSHSPWVLEASVEPVASGDASRLVMHLHYGGSLWGPVLEHMLGDEIERSKPRLIELVAPPPTSDRDAARG
jgi:hypothetical protein